MLTIFKYLEVCLSILKYPKYAYIDIDIDLVIEIDIFLFTFI